MKFFKYLPLLTCLSANAAQIPTPTQFVAGQKIVAASMNANFNAINTVVNGSIASDNIVNGGITTADLADSLITTAKILDSNVTTAKLADLAITSAKLADSSVTSGKISFTQPYWSGKHLNNCDGWVTGSAGLNTPSADGSCTLTELFNGGMGTIVSNATVYNGTLKYPGVVFAPPRIGAYMICATAAFDNSAGDAMYARLADDTDTLFEGDMRAGASPESENMTMCGISYAASVASKTVTITLGGQTGNTRVRAQQAANAINWIIHGL